ncbi:hypothetical protein ACEF09_10700 [Streptococcus suis]
MKIIVDTQKTVGDKFILLNKQELFEYKNNQKTDKIVGSKLTVLSLLDYERYSVKLPQFLNDLLVEERDQVLFNNLEGVPYVQNSRLALSLKASGVAISK